MIRILILAVLAVSTSVILPTPGLSQTSEANLRWQFPVGRKLEIEMTQRMKNAQNIAGKEIGTDIATTSFMTWEVEEVDSSSGVATIKSEIDRMTMNMKSPQGDFEIDSDSDEELEGIAQVVGKNVLSMVGKPFGQTMDARGQVLTVDFPPEFEKATMVMMGRGAMEKLIKNASPMFPDGPIAVGKSWTQETNTPMPGGMGAMALVSTYTYKGREMSDGKEMEVIDIDIDMTFETPEDGQATIEITDQKTEGKMYFDSNNGHMASMKVEQSMGMDITFGGQKISQVIENTTEGKFRLAK